MLHPLELVLAFGLDLLIGDPKRLPHPVKLIGAAVAKGEQVLRGKLPDRLGGLLLAAGIPAGVFGSLYAMAILLRRPESPVWTFAGSAVLIYLAASTLALRDLVRETAAVFRSFDLMEARTRLSGIVGRDTDNLDENGVCRAALESLAENTSDGVIAPLFYLALGGVPLAMAYKAVNTLDSMVGYKNEKYRDFGWAAARLDDILNYIPARLTGVLMVAAVSMLAGLGAGGRSLRVMLRDGRNHASPNSGYPEAAMAGALGVWFGGPSFYGERVVEKPRIGASGEDDCTGVLKPAVRIAAVASFLALLLALGGLLFMSMNLG